MMLNHIQVVENTWGVLKFSLPTVLANISIDINSKNRYNSLYSWPSNAHLPQMRTWLWCLDWIHTMVFIFAQKAIRGSISKHKLYWRNPFSQDLRINKRVREWLRCPWCK